MARAGGVEASQNLYNTMKAQGLTDLEIAGYTAKFNGQPVPRPPHWKGRRVVPSHIEFWKDGAHRLHERRLFVRTEDGWAEGLLYP